MNLIYSFSQAYPDNSGEVKVSLYGKRVVIERSSYEGVREKCVIAIRSLQSFSLEYPDETRNTRFHLEFNRREGASFWNEGDIKEKLEKFIEHLEKII